MYLLLLLLKHLDEGMRNRYQNVLPELFEKAVCRSAVLDIVTQCVYNVQT